MNKEAASILSRAREKRGWSQTEMAKRLAEALDQTYSLRQYQKLEEGNFPKFKREVIKQIDILLSTNIHELIYEQSVPRENTEDLKIRGKLIRLEATVTVLAVYVAELAAAYQKKSLASVSIELSKAIDEEAGRIAKGQNG